MKHYIPANNSSKGFHGILFQYILKYMEAFDLLLLVTEPDSVIPVFKKEFPELSIYNLDCERDEVDLNRLNNYDGTYYNMILAQAVLEHVSRPSVVIENLVYHLHSNGYLFLHTHNTKMKYHNYPIDCCRFYKDFFIDLQKYIGVELVEYDEWDKHIFVAYRRI